MKSLILGALLVLAVGCVVSDTVCKEVVKFFVTVVRKLHRWEETP